MASSRNNGVADDPLLDAARECILAVGWRRTTLTEVARRAGVSRMTLYRRWPDMQSLLADLMTRGGAAIAVAAPGGARGAGRARVPLARRWPDMQPLLADLMARVWSSIAIAAAESAATQPTG